MTRAPIIAHGIGGRLDLPVPVSYFAAGAAVVLIVSFVALAALWKKPRLQAGPTYDAKSTGSIPTWWLSWAGVLGLGLAVIGELAALLTGQESTGTRNIAPVLLWVYFWLVVPFAGLVLGNLYTAVNPWRTLGRWLGIGEVERARPRFGIWPAVIGLLAFAWLKLVYPNGSTPGAIAIAALVYTVVQLALMVRYGRETSLASFDIFTPYNRLLSSISPWGRTNEGRLAYRGWLRSLPAIPEWNGLAPFLIAMIGTVSFDGISNTTWYETLTGDLGMSVGGKTLILPLTCAGIGGAYYLACAAAARMGGDSSISAGSVATRFAHTLVPIAAAYAFAHYFTLVIFEGQSIVSAGADPFGLGWNLGGGRDYKIDFFLGAIPVWYLQVATIVAGHVAGVILAHDRALSDWRGLGAVRSQYAMLMLMVLLTGLGLFILAG
ncbi:MAG: hypothetical protein ACR2ME_09440 [Acidimicrobiia bacterium]